MLTPAPARTDIPEIVAHRGDAEHFPENSLPGLEAAWRHGLRHAEFDVQLSADGVPYVIHDADLHRTSRSTGDLRLMMSGQLDGVDACEPRRFGARHAGTHLPRLTAVAELMKVIPDARAFVELKRASLVHHGRLHCIEHVIAALDGVLDRCVMISFDAEACRMVRETAGLRIGWVFEGNPARHLAALEELRPEFAFCDHRELPAAGTLPAGSWTWAVYEVVDAHLARALHARGVAMVESMAPRTLLAELLKNGERPP
ncbi:MAG: glycerophosphodiester phosphodiesterase family protein [Steroidobacteraceae bacterium]